MINKYIKRFPRIVCVSFFRVKEHIFTNKIMKCSEELPSRTHGVCVFLFFFFKIIFVTTRKDL